MPKNLPPKPSLRQLQIQAKNLLKAHKRGDIGACGAFKLIHRYSKLTSQEIRQTQMSLRDAQFAVALQYGFGDWKELKAHVASMASAQQDPSGEFLLENVVGVSKPIQGLVKAIAKVADSDSTVLITGARGTGKELIAKAIHYNSGRSDKPMVVINCGAIPEALLESELFGHEKGAFTGAHRSRSGRFELADGGTIFLDEIVEMSPALQVKLLRILQDQEFERAGGTKTLHTDVRIIAATNKDLKAAVNSGTFREDLHNRLNVISIKVPSLKHRSEDLPLLVAHFLDVFQEDRDEKITVSPDAMTAMLDYEWPGNVTELENVVRRVTILCENPVAGIEDLPEHIRQPG